MEAANPPTRSHAKLDGFGKLNDRTLQFAPGFNLILGVNEAGKSTLQQTILSMLYGFFGEGRIIKESEQSHWKRLKPWDEQATYGEWLTYMLNEDQSFRVSRTFAPEFSTTLASYPNKIDLSMRFKRAEKGRLFFAEDQLGLSKDVFENVCTVRQAELVALETSATAVTETLMRFLASASTNTRAIDAMALLEKILETEVGLVNAPTQPRFKAKKHLSMLERERREVMRTRRKLFTQIAELNQLEESLEELDLKRRKMRYLQALAESDSIRQQLTTIDEIGTESKRLAKELAMWEMREDFPSELRDDVIKLSHERSRLHTEVNGSQQTAQEATEKIEPIKSQITTLKESIASLEDVRNILTDGLPQVQGLANEWRVSLKAKDLATEQFEKAVSSLDKVKEQSASERAVLQPAIKLGHTQLAEIRQNLLNAHQQLDQNKQSLLDTENEWNSLALNDELLEDLTFINDHLESGESLTALPIKYHRLLLTQTEHKLFATILDLKKSEDKLQELYLTRQRLQCLQALTESVALGEQLTATGVVAVEVTRVAEEVEKWASWAEFLAHLYADMIELTTRRTRLQAELEKVQSLAETAQKPLPPLKEKKRAAEARIETLSNSLNSSVRVDNYAQISDMAKTWEKMAEVQEAAQARWQESQNTFQQAEESFAQEQVELQPIIGLGSMGLAGLRHLLAATQDRVHQQAESLTQVESEWTEVGMEEDRFQEMEHAAEWIRAGAQADPERSKRLSNLPLFRRSSSYSQKELVVYGWLKSVYSNLVQSRGEVSEAQQSLDCFCQMKAPKPLMRLR